MKFLLALLLATLAPFANAQSLWGQTTLGMSVVDLRQAYPEAVEIQHEPTRRGGTSDYWQLKTDIAGESFTVSFFFREHRLDSAIVAPVTTDPAKRSTLVSTLRQALTQKYGAVANQQDIQGTFSQGTVWSWIKDGATISLELLTVMGEPISLQVRYDAKAAKAAEQL
jgi:hypothetical protein